MIRNFTSREDSTSFATEGASTALLRVLARGRYRRGKRAAHGRVVLCAAALAFGTTRPRTTSIITIRVLTQLPIQPIGSLRESNMPKYHTLLVRRPLPRAM